MHHQPYDGWGAKPHVARCQLLTRVRSNTSVDILRQNLATTHKYFHALVDGNCRKLIQFQLFKKRKGVARRNYIQTIRTMVIHEINTISIIINTSNKDSFLSTACKSITKAKRATIYTGGLT